MCSAYCSSTCLFNEENIKLKSYNIIDRERNLLDKHFLLKIGIVLMTIIDKQKIKNVCCVTDD